MLTAEEVPSMRAAEDLPEEELEEHSEHKDFGTAQFLVGMAIAVFVVTGPLGSLVAVNGLLTHWLMASHSRFATAVGFYDMAVNAVLIGVVNYDTSWKPQTAILTTVAIVIFLAKWASARYSICQCHIQGWAYCAVHVLGVGLPLFIPLYIYEQEKRYEWGLSRWIF